MLQAAGMKRGSLIIFLQIAEVLATVCYSFLIDSDAQFRNFTEMF
jgi:hypothetical protein